MLSFSKHFWHRKRLLLYLSGVSHPWQYMGNIKFKAALDISEKVCFIPRYYTIKQFPCQRSLIHLTRLQTLFKYTVYTFASAAMVFLHIFKIKAKKAKSLLWQRYKRYYNIKYQQYQQPVPAALKNFLHIFYFCI